MVPRRVVGLIALLFTMWALLGASCCEAGTKACPNLDGYCCPEDYTCCGNFLGYPCVPPGSQCPE